MITIPTAGEETGRGRRRCTYRVVPGHSLTSDNKRLLPHLCCIPMPAAPGEVPLQSPGGEGFMAVFKLMPGICALTHGMCPVL